MSNPIFSVPGIGDVVTSHKLGQFVDFLFCQKNAISDEKKIKKLIEEMLNNPEDEMEFITTDIVTKIFSREDVEIFEKKGIIVTLHNEKYLYGTYALGCFDLTVETPRGASLPQIGEGNFFRFSSLFKGKFSLVTKSPVNMSKEEIQNAGFEDIDVHAQVLAICKKNKEGKWQWGKSNIYPDGFHIQAPLTSTEQYAQSCFEGLVALVNKAGEIVIFRPQDNAKRLAFSCSALAIPPFDEDQFVESVKYAVLANKDYLPNPGSNAKMYIRPYIKGLEGGYGVSPANSYLFAVEVFPFGDYISKREDVINIVGIKGKRRSHEGGIGSTKTSGNYGQTILDKQIAKYGLISGYEGRKFSDTFYLGEKKEKLEVNGKAYTIVKDVLDENSAGNLFFIEEKKGEINLVTVPLERKSILGGFTRDSVLKLAKYLGFNSEEREIELKDLENFSGAFLTGSAAGAVRIGSMTYDGKTYNFDNAEEGSKNATKVTETFFKIYDTLYQGRKGKLKGIKDFGIGEWAMIIGRV